MKTKKRKFVWINGVRCRKLRKGVKRTCTDVYASGESLKSYIGLPNIGHLSETYRPVPRKRKVKFRMPQDKVPAYPTVRDGKIIGYEIMEEIENDRPTKAGLLVCAKWMSACLKIGWKKDQLDDLERIFWKYRDRNGNLKATKL